MLAATDTYQLRKFRPSQSQTLVLVIALASWTSVALKDLLSLDIFTFLSATLVAVGRSRPWWLPGAAVLGHAGP